jgi:hypothetical protein
MVGFLVSYHKCYCLIHIHYYLLINTNALIYNSQFTIPIVHFPCMHKDIHIGQSVSSCSVQLSSLTVLNKLDATRSCQFYTAIAIAFLLLKLLLPCRCRISVAYWLPCFVFALHVSWRRSIRASCGNCWKLPFIQNLVRLLAVVVPT